MIAQPGIALVSTRQSTAGRLGQAVRLACNLATRGLVIFSAPVRVWTRPESRQSPPRAGLGRFWGQEGTLIYPKQNTRLTEQIVTLGGVLILEFPMSTLAAPQNISHSHHQ